MPTFPDISEYYTPLLALHEDQSWLWERHWKGPIEFLQPLLESGQVKNVVEFGCGSGLVAAALPPAIEYRGIDKNNWFLERARRRNPRKNAFFQNWDLRNYDLVMTYDLSMSWNVLKHFALNEFDKVLTVLLHAGRKCAFNVQLAERDFDDGMKYHHTFVRRERLQAVVDAAGHKIVHEKTVKAFVVCAESVREVYFLTEERPRVHGLTVGVVKKEEEPPRLQSLSIEGTACMDLERYALRWVKTAEGAEAELYKDGKRVTKAWRLKLEITKAADDVGGNANTAD